MATSFQELSPELELFGGVSKSLLMDFHKITKLTPAQFMQPTLTRSWIPLFSNRPDALARAKWGCEELNCVSENEAEDILIFKVTFTTLGFGTYHLLQQLTTCNWNNWRFHGDLDENVLSREGHVLIRIEV